MKNSQSKLSAIKKYWISTPEFFSEKYSNNLLELISPVNLFLLSRRKKVLNLAGDVSQKKILDVGCGSGIFMADFIKKGAYVAGIDYSQRMLDLAQELLVKLKLPKTKYVLSKASATNIPFKDHYFDIVLATGLTDYLSDQENKLFFKDAARVLKKDGMIIVSFPSQISPFAFVRSGAGLWLRQKFFKLPPIRNEFSQEKIRSFLWAENLQEKQHYKIFQTMWIVIAKLKNKKS